MDTYAWDNHLPCLNPHCKSHGKPHPNCRCYGMSDGGEVGQYCNGPHKEGCEYYMASGGEINPDEVIVNPPINPDEVKTEISPDEVKLTNKYETTEQKIKTGLEGAAQGLAGPVAPWVETHLLGVNPEDIKGRAEANPLIHGGSEAATFVGSMLTGVGEAGLIAKGAEAAAKAAEIGKVGSMALKGAIESASFTGADEITKAILNQPGSDTESPVSSALLHVGAAGLMGGLGGSVFGLGEKMIGKGIESLDNPQVQRTAAKFLNELAESPDPLGKIGASQALRIKKEIASWGIAAVASSKLGVPAPVAYGAIEAMVEKPFQKAIGKLNKYATAGILHCLSSDNPEGILNAVHYANNILKGSNKVNHAMSSLFSAGVSKIAPEISGNEKDKLRNFIENGQVDRQMQNSLQGNGMAGGGMVSAEDSQFARAMPTQNMLLNTAKGRISGYLNSVRPLPNQTKLPFDRANPQKEKHRSYDRALDLAVNPMQILNHVNDGSLTPEDMKHFTGMYPEAHRYLSKKMTEKISEMQLKEEIPPYKKVKSMSLFLGANLDSTLTPFAMNLIQGMYTMNKAQGQQQPQKPQKSSTLSKEAPSYLTNQQARVQRSQNQKA